MTISIGELPYNRQLGIKVNDISIMYCADDDNLSSAIGKKEDISTIIIITKFFILAGGMKQ